jgi:hypothetical protein
MSNYDATEVEKTAAFVGEVGRLNRSTVGEKHVDVPLFLTSETPIRWQHESDVRVSLSLREVEAGSEI